MVLRRHWTAWEARLPPSTSTGSLPPGAARDLIVLVEVDMRKSSWLRWGHLVVAEWRLEYRLLRRCHCSGCPGRIVKSV